ncbi:MAG: Mur ligase domain-containing protein [Pontiella sp.]
MKRIHFIGIGGVGMNGLAQLAAQSGYQVTGSDRAYRPNAEVFQGLEKLGIEIFTQDGSGITTETTQVVFSTAIESDNPDLQQTNSLNTPLLHRAEFLKELIGDDELIAVAGTAGKTTTTGLLGWIFQCLKKDPSVYNGAAIANWKHGLTLGNIRKGNSNLWIIEADESDKSFLNFNPTHAIITNISKDHYELDELHTMFNQFEEQTSGITVRGDEIDFQALEIEIPMLGKHNAENAACALELCKQLGFNETLVRKAISGFKGIERRLELIGTVDGITIFDDYAHNPSKISAALSAVSEKFGTVHAYWRPHGFKPLFQGLDEFTDVFSKHWEMNGGSIFILPVFYSGGTTVRNVCAADLVKRLKLNGIPAELVADYPDLKQKLQEKAQRGDAIIGMGARDPELPLFARRVIAEWKK